MDARRDQKAVGQRHMNEEPNLERRLKRMVEIQIVLLAHQFAEPIMKFSLLGIEVPTEVVHFFQQCE